MQARSTKHMCAARKHGCKAQAVRLFFASFEGQKLKGGQKLNKNIPKLNVYGSHVFKIKNIASA